MVIYRPSVTVSPTLTLGEILQIATMIVGVTAIIVGVRVEMTSMKAAMKALSDRVGTHETTLFSMFGQLQRLVGIVDTEHRTPR